MTRLKTLFVISAIVVLGAALAGCPPKNDRPELSSSERRALEERMRKNDVLYEIILKDDPLQSETLKFRRDSAEAKNALRGGDYDKAERLIGEAEQWVREGRSKYYREHEAKIASGDGGESADGLMEEAVFFKEKALAHQSAGDEWTAEQYFQAAVEQGELALLAAKRDPEKTIMLIELSREMQGIYSAAGRPDQAEASKERVARALQSSLNILADRIEDKLEGRAEGYDEKTLSEGGPAFERAVRRLKAENAKRNALAEAARSYAPGMVQANDYSMAINAWANKWLASYSRKPESKDDKQDVKHDKDAVLRAALRKHNEKYREPSESIEGTGIALRETGVYTRGEAVVIRGELQNFRTEPIYNPRVTVVGQVYSEIVDLEYDSFPTLMQVPFHVTLQGFTAEALKTSGLRPEHELVLIFEEKNGVTRMVRTRQFK